MARPEKCKRICSIPEKRRFVCGDGTPQSSQRVKIEQDELIMSMEEFETIRLIDYIGFTQEQCAEQMGVARTTVQRMYNEARNKIARFFITGESLEIAGGSYKVCEEQDSCCEITMCPMRQCGCQCDKNMIPIN